MEDVFTGHILQKTVVPPTWDAKKLCEAAWELYEGFGKILSSKNGGFVKTGIIDGVDMEIYYTSKKECLMVDKIITSYPIGIREI